MGIIKRQGIKQGIVHYTATAIAGLSVIFVYPHGEGMYGLAGFLTGAAAIIAPFASLGANALTIRFFPTFKNEVENHYGFIGIVLGYGTLCLLIFGLLAFFFESYFINLLITIGFKEEVVGQYSFYAFALAGIMVWINILTSHSSNFGRIAIPAVFNSLINKIVLPILILLFIGRYLTEQSFALGVLGYHFMGMLGLVAYLYSLGELKLKPKLNFLNPPLIKSMGIFAMFGIMGSLGSAMAHQIDRVMVPGLMGLKAAEIYNITLFIGTAIEIPTRTIIAVTSPIIAAAWHNNDRLKVKELYRRASINLFLVGLFLFLLVWISLDHLFQLTGKFDNLQAGQFVVFWVGITKLFDMATSVNGQVIGYSKYFKFNLISIVILGVMNVYLNYYFIQIWHWGIVGPAIASFISITLFNLLRVGFIWFKFKIQPFSWENLIAIAIGLTGFWIVYLIPDFSSAIVNIAVNSILITLFYVLPIYLLKISADFNDLINRGLTWIGLGSIIR